MTEAAMADGNTSKQDAAEHVEKSDTEWRTELSPQQYRVLREKGTEAPFTGKYWNEHADGVYRCAACGNPLFDAATKFESGTGWPSFYRPIQGERVATEDDRSFLMRRTEVHCARCGGHLGHLFDDGPQPTGLRYCINSTSLELDKEAK
ncbi:MAG: peptide-methionine (R)-S-oxide reductase MsrB [Gemmatimonadaceae bacterium]